MSNRFHNKFHRHNHHTEPSDDLQFPDSSYDPIASPESPFRGAFVLNGSLSANGDTKLNNLTCDNITIEGNQLYTGVVFFQAPVNVSTDLQVVGTSISNNSEIAGTLNVNGDVNVGNNVLYVDTGRLTVGINITAPEEALTVVGNISASGKIHADGYNSATWDTAYEISTAYSLASSTFITTETDSQTLSFNEGTKDLTISSGNTVSLSALVDSIAISSTDTDVRALTANWEDTSTVVQINSAYWDTAYEIGTAYSSASSTFLTTETDSQTLSFNEGTKDLTISSGNTVSLSALVDSVVSSGVDTDVRSLTATWDDTSTVVQSNSASWNYQGSDLKALSANWETAYEIGTAYSSASSTFLTSETDSQTLSFDEGTNDLTISNGNTISLSALVDGIDTDVRALTANWEDSSTVVQSNSADWNTAYEISTAYSSVSSTFLTTETDSQSLSFDENNKDLTISNGNTVSLSALVDLTAMDTGVRALTANWDDTSTVVQSNSASWAVDNSIDTDVRSLTANWDDTSTVVQSNSASWAIDNSIDTDVRALTANWNDTYTVVQSNSASWAVDNSIDTDVRALTATWQDSSTVVQSNSADWNSTYSTVQANSATTWNYQGTDLKALSGNWQTTYLASSAYVVSDPTGITGANALTKLIQITQAGYNAIITPSSDTLYVIVG
jgi:hypothetical protein